MTKKSDGIKLAADKLKKLSEDDDFRRAALRREMEIHDYYNDVISNRELGKSEGKAEGKELGKLETEQKNCIKALKKVVDGKKLDDYSAKILKLEDLEQLDILFDLLLDRDIDKIHAFFEAL